MDLGALAGQTGTMKFRREKKEDRMGRGRMAFTVPGAKAGRMWTTEGVRVDEGS